MTMLTRDESFELLGGVLEKSEADHCTVRLSGSTGGNIRYARNSVSTAGVTTNMSLSVQSTFGQKTGSSSINEFDEDSLTRAVSRSEELARLAPENREFVEPLGPQRYQESNAYFESTASTTPERRTRAAADSISVVRENGLVAAGFIQDSGGFRATRNSAGLFNYRRSSNVSFSVTVRTEDGTGSGWASRDYNDVSLLNTSDASRIASEKASASANAVALDPGDFTVILEPAAAHDLIRNMMFNFDARRAEEGRSFLSKGGGETKLGEKLMDDKVTIYSDHTHPDVPAAPWAGDGRPRARTTWVENGVIRNLSYSRYWALHKGVEATPRPANIILDGSDTSLEDIIRDTQRGILVTRLWYIRTVDPRTLLYTGLTRDGTFLIENGSVKHAVKNFRFNESPVAFLNSVDVLGEPVRFNGNFIPPMRVRDFSFTSLSDAV